MKWKQFLLVEAFCEHTDFFITSLLMKSLLMKSVHSVTTNTILLELKVVLRLPENNSLELIRIFSFEFEKQPNCENIYNYYGRNRVHCYLNKRTQLEQEQIEDLDTV